MSEEKTERWAISPSEMDRLESLSSEDELLAVYQPTDDIGCPLGDAHQVIVLRSGEVTNRNYDGVVGVTDAIRDIIKDEDVLYHPAVDRYGEVDWSDLEMTARWVDVVVGPDGKFLRQVEASPMFSP